MEGLTVTAFIFGMMGIMAGVRVEELIKTPKEKGGAFCIFLQLMNPYKGLTKYFTNPLNTGVSEGKLTEWE